MFFFSYFFSLMVLIRCQMWVSRCLSTVVGEENLLCPEHNSCSWACKYCSKASPDNCGRCGRWSTQYACSQQVCLYPYVIFFVLCFFIVIVDRIHIVIIAFCMKAKYISEINCWTAKMIHAYEIENMKKLNNILPPTSSFVSSTYDRLESK